MHRPSIFLLLLGLSVLGQGRASADTFRIEIDYMTQTGAGAHSHMPTPAEVAAVVQMFACQGHTLIVDVDDAIPHYNVLNRNPGDANEFFEYQGVANSYGKIKDTYFDNGSGWHYCVFGHQYQDKSYVASTSSGLGELGGDDFVVTLGTFTGQVGTAFDRAATLAHEFGHNLGLSHCGSMECIDTASANYAGNGPPNLPSIMSYAYQLQGVRTNLVCQGLSFDEAALFKEIDYSHGRMCNLDENNLVEAWGAGMVGVDFDCDGNVAGTVAQDLEGNGSGWCGANGKRTGMWDYDEWSNISSSAKSKSPEQLKHLPVAACISSDEVAAFRNKAMCAQPALTTEACVTGEMMYLDASPNAVEDGRCIVPYNDLASAQAASTDGSVFFLKPGTYDEPAAVVLDRRLKLFSTGPAVIR